MSYRTFLIVLFFFLLGGCTNKTNNKKVSDLPVTIFVQPFSDVDLNDVKYVVLRLKKVYPSVLQKEPIKLPVHAFYRERGRYRADSIIQFLNSTAKENAVIIGLTSMDISATKGVIKDWGIMGLGFCPGKACVASTFRLSPLQRREQLFKVTIHELGHTQGLPHCPVKTCFMRDAEGGNPINEEQGFCAKCRSLLLSKGWQLN